MDVIRHHARRDQIVATTMEVAEGIENDRAVGR